MSIKLMRVPQFLIIEDDKDTVDFINEILSSEFPKSIIKNVYTNDQAYMILESFTPDLITTDIGRPGGGGFNFIESLKKAQDLRLRNIPIIVISGQVNPNHPDGENIELKLYRAGVRKVFYKPFKVKEVLDCISELLSAL